MIGVIVGAVSGLAQAAYNFYQADKQDKAASAAREKSKKLMKSARKRAEIDMFAGMTLPFDAYTSSNDEFIRNQTTTTQALQEADVRMLGGTTLGAQNTKYSEALRNQMGQDLMNLDYTKRQSRQNINDTLRDFDIGEAEGKAQEQRDQQELRANSVSDAFSGLTSAATSIADGIALYPEQPEKITPDFSTPKKLDIDVTGGNQGTPVVNPPKSRFNFSAFAAPIKNPFI
tara:strand:- start:1485 stop:2174 length:690 start_codon:yes stop_codon:yes gene_type:complete